jgi:hypothetical protein
MGTREVSVDGPAQPICSGKKEDIFWITEALVS